MSAANDGPDLALIAGEFVLGTLDRDERETFAARLHDDETARAAVAEWERRLAGLRSRIVAVPPPPEVWTRIESALQTRGAKLSPFRVIDGGGRSAVPQATIRRSRDRWRAGALAASGIAAVLVAFVFAQETGVLPSRQPSGPIYVAAVNRGGQKPALIVRVDFETRKVLVRPVEAPAPTGHSLQLWYIGDGDAPRSMGLVKDDATVLPIPRGAPGDRSATFAVSLEPPGGSTTGAPTGQVVYSGQLVKE